MLQNKKHLNSLLIIILIPNFLNLHYINKKYNNNCEKAQFLKKIVHVMAILPDLRSSLRSLVGQKLRGARFLFYNFLMVFLLIFFYFNDPFN